MIAQMKEDNKRLLNLTLRDVQVPLINLPLDHPARKYITNRQIPEKAWKYLSWTDCFKSVTARLEPDRAEGMITGEGRILISTFDIDGKLTGVAGRSIDPNNEKRYIHVKASHNYPKIFGLDRLKNFTGEMFVFEGPLDATFFDDSLATCDADLAFANRFHDKLILVHDNQPRNKDIVRNVHRAIENGFRVCLFPETNPHKDINEMILAGMLVEDIRKEILDNTFQGMTAELNFGRWKKT